MLKFGEPPYLECSSRGDKRFSAFHARMSWAPFPSIEQEYQRCKVFEDGSTGLHWRQAKGRKAVNQEWCNDYYYRLWKQYIGENGLLPVLKAASGLSDMFGQEGHVCQAEVLWRIRNERTSTTVSDGTTVR